MLLLGPPVGVPEKVRHVPVGLRPLSGRRRSRCDRQHREGTYTVLDLGYVPWTLWSTDRATGEADLNAKATEESFLGDTSPSGRMPEPQSTDHARGARRIAGKPSRVVVTVGISHDAAAALEVGLADCEFEHRALGEIEPADCGSLLPTLVLVDATGPVGTTFARRPAGQRPRYGRPWWP